MTAGALMPMDRAGRIERVGAELESAGCDGLVVTKPENVRWLTGFTGSNGTLVVTGSATTLITDGRYTTQADQELAAAGLDLPVAIDREGRDPAVAATAGLSRIGLEAQDVTWARQRLLSEWFDGQELVPVEDLIEGMRRTKDEGEIERLRAAAAIADRALEVVRPELTLGRTEQEIARRLDAMMLELGADDISFPTIVASGPNSAKPHATPSDRVIGDGDLVVIDFGAKVDGYGSDMTRTFAVGTPSERQLELYRAVEQAQAEGMAGVGSGVEERRIDEICRHRLAAFGLGDAFVHGTGHGIGLEIHENPILSARSTGILRSGYVVTVEPGVYLPEVGGVRIEDSVLVTADGCEPITLSPKTPNP